MKTVQKGNFYYLSFRSYIFSSKSVHILVMFSKAGPETDLTHLQLLKEIIHRTRFKFSSSWKEKGLHSLSRIHELVKYQFKKKKTITPEIFLSVSKYETYLQMSGNKIQDYNYIICPWSHMWLNVRAYGFLILHSFTQ